MILLIGLPASGKTTWANKYREENPDKRFYVIGTSALVERMKVDGEPRKKHFSGKWDHLIQKCTRCLQDWLKVASQRRRNFIVDQVRGQKEESNPARARNMQTLTLMTYTQVNYFPLLLGQFTN